MEFFEKFGIVLMVVWFAFAIFCILGIAKHQDECTERGGIYVQGTNGYVCLDKKAIKP